MYKEAWGKILDAKHIVLVSHIHPDGDTIGSSLALYNTLKNLGKRVSLFNATKDELPKEFDFIEGYNKISNTLPNFFDLLISCDCGSFDRLKIKKGDFDIINIDHHASNDGFGDTNIVLEEYSSAGMVVYKFLKENDIVITKNTAIALYTSIADDTGFFRYGGIGAKTFEAALELIKAGADPQEIARKVNSRQSLAKTRLRAFVLNNFEFHCDASIASIIISKEVLAQTGAKRRDTKNIIRHLRDIVNVEVAVMVLEQDDFFKISLRSSGDKNVSKISIAHQGGGHKNAAGFNMVGKDAQSVTQDIIKGIRAL